MNEDLESSAAKETRRVMLEALADAEAREREEGRELFWMSVQSLALVAFAVFAWGWLV